MHLLDKYGEMKFAAADAFVHFIKDKLVEDIDTMSNNMSQCIQYVAPSFQKKYSSCNTGFREGIPDHVFGALHGTIIMPAEQGYHTSFYSLNGSIINGEFSAVGFIYTFIVAFDNPTPVLMFSYQNGPDRNRPMLYLANAFQRAGLQAQSYFEDFITFLLFRQYCQIETRLISPKGAVSFNDYEYHNLAGLTVEVLDSTWFTHYVGTTVKVAEKDGGFWRNQPCGPGRTERIPKWINAFDRTYNRPPGRPPQDSSL